MKLAASCGLIRIHLIFLYECRIYEPQAKLDEFVGGNAIHKDIFKMLPNGLRSDVYKYLNLSSG